MNLQTWSHCSVHQRIMQAKPYQGCSSPCLLFKPFIGKTNCVCPAWLQFMDSMEILRLQGSISELNSVPSRLPPYVISNTRTLTHRINAAFWDVFAEHDMRSISALLLCELGDVRRDEENCFSSTPLNRPGSADPFTRRAEDISRCSKPYFR